MQPSKFLKWKKTHKYHDGLSIVKNSCHCASQFCNVLICIDVQSETNSDNGHLLFSIFKKNKKTTKSAIFCLYSKDIVKPDRSYYKQDVADVRSTTDFVVFLFKI